MAKSVNTKFGTVKQAGFTSSMNVEDRTRSFHRGINASKDALSSGIVVDYNNLSQIQRGIIQKELDESGLGIEASSLEYMYLPSSFKDRAINSYYNKRTIVADIFDGAESICDSTAKLVEQYAKSLHANDLDVLGVTTDGTTLNAGETYFGKTLTTNITALHAVADQSIGILNERTLPFQAMIPTEANIGKDVMYDIIPPYTGLASAYFGDELSELQDSDFDVYTRTDRLRFMYSNGVVSDAAIKLGRSAYPSREFLSLSTRIHQNSARHLRERRLLGVDNNIRSASFSYMKSNGLDYMGIHEMVSNQSNPIDGLTTVVSGASVTNSDAKTQYENLDKLMNELAIKMNIANNVPNVMICDPATFSILRNGLMKYQYQVPPTPSAAFGISAIQYNLQGFQPMEVVAHPFLPSASGQSALYMLNTKLLARRIGWLDTVDLLAKYSNLTTRFAVSSAETFIDKSDVNGTSTLQGAILGITHQ